MILKLRTDDGQFLGNWRVTAEAPEEITPEFLQPLADAINRHRHIERLKASGGGEAYLDAWMLEIEAEEEMLDNWDKSAKWGPA
jgi:hypothetical protein